TPNISKSHLLSKLKKHIARVKTVLNQQAGK
ncbi:50S ribosomal protein L29, partial [Pseudomonas fulva]